MRSFNTGLQWYGQQFTFRLRIASAKSFRSSWLLYNVHEKSLIEGEWELNYSRFSPVMWSKLKIVTIQWIKSRIWDTIDDWYINNLAKNQVSAVFQSRVICRSVTAKVIELCMETPSLCPPEGHKYGRRKVTEASVTEFCYWNANLLP